MNLKEHYNNLYTESIKKITHDNYQIDDLIDASLDQRFGITLLIRPSIKIKNEIQKFLNQLKLIDPNQYYYKNSDIHITVMSITSCYEGFKLENINPSEYIKIIKESIITNSNIKIKFKGITASPSCIMIQGFMTNESLNIIRNNLRENFKNTTLEQSIDKRYSIQTAHSTVVRFKKKLNKKSNFLKTIESFKDYNFGSFSPKNIELVYNDWYQKEKHVKKLFKFNI
ncbi:mutarotase [Thalassobellus suaedae]|uniref:Mutarotase n=1 Tax=Thalassobellus suaedae TaxID=3074124 RepID=A0ABY9XUR1_9FLAO|nr:mutarotase [Flavobacteriaceae bacterium HL-DH14]